MVTKAGRQSFADFVFGATLEKLAFSLIE
jgi:hypothetical protein